MTAGTGDPVAAHSAADLAMRYAHRHEQDRAFALAALNYLDAGRLYGECGCPVLADLAWAGYVDCVEMGPAMLYSPTLGRG